MKPKLFFYVTSAAMISCAHSCLAGNYLFLDTAATEPSMADNAIAVLLVVGVVYWLWRRSKKKKAGNGDTSDSQGAPKHYANVKSEGGKGMSMEEARKAQTEILSNISANDEQKITNAAAQLMTSGKYDAAIAAYTEINKNRPDEADVWLSQIGAAYYFKGDYDKAIENYVASRDAGFDKGMADDNIWEAVEEQFKKTGSRQVLESYSTYCPNGSNMKKMKKILSSLN